MFYVYVLQSLVDKTLYIGMTNNLKRRISQHNVGKVRSTKAKKPFKLIYQESFNSRIEAREREKYYKTGFGREQLKTTFF